MSETITFPLHRVSIETARGNETLSTLVPLHEIRVLKAVHGPDKVHDLGETEDEIELHASADAEFARMQRKYRRINSPDPVLLAYPMGASVLKDGGFAMDRGRTEAAPQAGIRKHAKPKKADAKKKADKAE